MKRLLIVDDERLLLEAMQHHLRDVPDVEVRTAATADEGMDVARDWRPDLVLSDVNTGDGSDGFDLAVVLSALEVRVVLMSGYVSEARQKLAKEVGAAMLLAKPFNVRDTVLALLGRAA